MSHNMGHMVVIKIKYDKAGESTLLCWSISNTVNMDVNVCPLWKKPNTYKGLQLEIRKEKTLDITISFGREKVLCLCMVNSPVF